MFLLQAALRCRLMWLSNSVVLVRPHVSRRWHQDNLENSSAHGTGQRCPPVLHAGNWHSVLHQGCPDGTGHFPHDARDGRVPKTVTEGNCSEGISSGQVPVKKKKKSRYITLKIIKLIRLTVHVCSVSFTMSMCPITLITIMLSAFTGFYAFYRTG